MNHRKITLDQLHAEMKSQGVPFDHVAFKCSMCDTVQSAASMLRAGVGKTLEDVRRFLGYSCIGRWSNPMRPPHETKGQGIGCDWTIGGLFKIGGLTVVDGETEHIAFDLATPAEAQQLRDQIQMEDRSHRRGDGTT